jgi:hypothetical protein
MDTNMVKAKCGQCGGDKYELYKRETSEFTIVAECVQCKNKSYITIMLPRLEIKPAPDARGNIVFDKNY